MSNMNFNCDVCGREVQGCTFVNGMKFCAKCYQETFGNKNMTENLNNMYEAYLKILNEKDKQIADLQSQLAEKEVDINRINKAFLENRSLWKGKYEQAHQNKISFAVEQLEKVKEFFLKEHKDEELDTDYLITKDAGEIADFLLNQIRQLKDQQINELKGKVEDVKD